MVLLRLNRALYDDSLDLDGLLINLFSVCLKRNCGHGADAGKVKPR